MDKPRFDPMRIACPYIPMFISGDDAGNAVRQAQADAINKNTNRIVDARETMNRFVDLLRRNPS